MPAIASLADLKAAREAVLATLTPEAISVLKEWGPRVGWKNLMRLVVYGTTPEKLKEEKPSKD